MQKNKYKILTLLRNLQTFYQTALKMHLAMLEMEIPALKFYCYK